MPFEPLTPRQLEIGDLICLEDLSAPAIALRLSIDVDTVHAHVQAIAQRLANPHGLPARKLIRSYAAARRVARERELAQRQLADRAASWLPGPPPLLKRGA